MRWTAAACCRSTLTGFDATLSPFEFTAVTTKVETPLYGVIPVNPVETSPVASVVDAASLPSWLLTL